MEYDRGELPTVLRAMVWPRGSVNRGQVGVSYFCGLVLAGSGLFLSLHDGDWASYVMFACGVGMLVTGIWFALWMRSQPPEK
jgi:hypothetical protein